MADVGGLAVDRLRSFIERAERLREEKKALENDLKEVFAEARATGFDVKAMKVILNERSADQGALDEHNTILDVYRRALGMVPDFSVDNAPVEEHAHLRVVREAAQ